MDAIETQVQRTSPILRVTTDIKELRLRDNNKFLGKSRTGCNNDADLRHASNLLQKKKQLRPIIGSGTPNNNPYRSGSFYNASPYAVYANSKSNVGPFTQRVMSAKLLRVKKLQNELKETQILLNEAINENRLLKTLQKRQDNALKKYEGDNAQLPQLIKSHNDDLRVVSTQYKQLKSSYRELEQKLRQRDAELLSLKDQHRHLIKLSRDKNLGQREKLMKQVEDLQDTINEQHEKIQLLNRRVELEGKNYKHQLGVEMAKHKDTHTELALAHETIDTLKNIIEAKEKYINNTVPNRHSCGGSNVGNIQIFTNNPSTTRYKNVTKGTGLTQEKPTSKDASVLANAELFDDLDTDITSELSSAINARLKNNSILTDNLTTEPTASLNLKRKLLTRKSRMKFSIQNSSVEPSSVTDAKLDEDTGNNDTETPIYTSSFPSFDNSEDSLKYNTTSESDTMTKISLNAKNRRRVSIDSTCTSISENNTTNNKNNTTNNKNANGCKENSSKNNKDDGDKSKLKPKKRNVIGKKRPEENPKELRLRRSSAAICESDNGTLDSISEAVQKAKKRDEVTKKLMINKEIKILEEKLNKASNEAESIIKFPLNRDDNSLENLLDRKTEMMKNELKDFEERLLNSNNIKKYASSNHRLFEDEANDVVKKLTSSYDLTENLSSANSDEGDINEYKLNNNPDVDEVSFSWDKINRKLQDNEEHTDSILDEYYKKVMLNDDSEDTKGENEPRDSKDIELGNDDKEKLLKALKQIDLEKVSRDSSTDEGCRGRRNSVNKTVDFNPLGVDGKPSLFDDYEFSLTESGNNNESGDYTREYDSSFIKSKNDLMAELFGKPKDISVVDGNDLEKT